MPMTPKTNQQNLGESFFTACPDVFALTVYSRPKPAIRKATTE